MSTGIHIEDCDDVEMTGNTFIGMDKAIHAVRSRNIRASDNIVVSKEIAHALASKDTKAFMAALGLPGTANPSEVKEVIQIVADNRNDLATAEVKVRQSPLIQGIGVAANISQIVGTVYSMLQAGVIEQAMALLQ